MIGERDEADGAKDALLNHEAMNDPLVYPAQVMVEEGHYALEEGSCWITVGNLSVYVKREEEGIKIDVYPLNDEMGSAISSTSAFFEDAETEEGEA